jgi:hypothetical protein
MLTFKNSPDDYFHNFAGIYSTTDVCAHETLRVFTQRQCAHETLRVFTQRPCAHETLRVFTQRPRAHQTLRVFTQRPHAFGRIVHGVSGGQWKSFDYPTHDLCS